MLSPDGPNGGLNASDKFINHNVNGVWINVGGAAAHISAAQDGSLWVVNSLGGIYHNINNTWYPIAGGAKDISVAPNGTIYVISKAPGNAGIFHYDGANWTQLPGAATSIAASPDTAEILLAEIDPGVARAKRVVKIPGEHEIDRVHDRRPEMYAPLTANPSPRE